MQPALTQPWGHKAILYIQTTTLTLNPQPRQLLTWPKVACRSVPQPAVVPPVVHEQHQLGVVRACIALHLRLYAIGGLCCYCWCALFVLQEAASCLPGCQRHQPTCREVQRSNMQVIPLSIAAVSASRPKTLNTLSGLGITFDPRAVECSEAKRKLRKRVACWLPGCQHHKPASSCSP